MSQHGQEPDLVGIKKCLFDLQTKYCDLVWYARKEPRDRKQLDIREPMIRVEKNGLMRFPNLKVMTVIGYMVSTVEPLLLFACYRLMLTI
jgi:hypothetical protein